MLFTCPAAYEPYVRATIATTLAEIGRDVDRRADEDARIQRLATVPDQFIAPDAPGRVAILLTVVASDDVARDAEPLLITAGALP